MNKKLSIVVPIVWLLAGCTGSEAPAAPKVLPAGAKLASLRLVKKP